MYRKRTFGLVLPMALALSACGGGGGSGQSSPQPQPPAQPAASIVPVEGPARDLPADYASYNFNLLRVSGQVESAALVQGLRALNPGGLRIPGGTPGETWSWSRGGLRPPPYPGLPAGSGFSAEIEAISILAESRAGVPT